jgi:hypothetical protein
MTTLDLVARLDGFTLTEGEHPRSVRFAIPADAAPSYASSSTTIEYVIEVRVDIPWWPDRRERYIVPVKLAGQQLGPAQPHSYCTSKGPMGTELYIEASFDSDRVHPGDGLHGAVSLSNVAAHRIRRVELRFVANELPLSSSLGDALEVASFGVVLHEGAPGESAPIPVSVRVPDDAVASFRGALLMVTWVVEVRAVIAFGSDVVLQVPLMVVPRPVLDQHRTPAALPMRFHVGRERRALVFAEVARIHELEFDSAAERLTGHCGDVAVGVSIEQREKEGYWQTAELRWPPLGIDLRLAERRWLDALGADPIKVAGIERWTVGGREAAQVMAFFVWPLRTDLEAFEEAALDDDGGALATRGSAFSVEELSAFVSCVMATARVIEEARRCVPAPAAMAPHVERWREFAERTGGRFEIGRFFIRGAVLHGERYDLGTEWEKASPLATVVRIDCPHASAPPSEAQAGIAAARQVGWNVVTEDAGVCARGPAPLADPGSLDALYKTLAAIARARRGAPHQGPYR